MKPRNIGEVLRTQLESLRQQIRNDLDAEALARRSGFLRRSPRKLPLADSLLVLRDLGYFVIRAFQSGGGWTHPVHVHLSDFFVLARNGSSLTPLEQGRKDTLNVGASFGDASVLIKFDEFTGRYVFHCHNIEHEDMRMMGQFEVQP